MSQATEKQIRIAAKMYEARDTLRKLWGAEYAAKLKPMMEIVEAVADDRGISALQASIDMAKEIDAEGKMDAGTMWQLMVAAVELTEPTSPQP